MVSFLVTVYVIGIFAVCAFRMCESLWGAPEAVTYAIAWPVFAVRGFFRNLINLWRD
jgi:hypothetical protein